VTAGPNVLGVTRQAPSNVINSRSGVDPELAIRLTKAVGSNGGDVAAHALAYNLAAELP
jgi:plasmid maintenance system antidote protein VapI